MQRLYNVKDNMSSNLYQDSAIIWAFPSVDCMRARKSVPKISSPNCSEVPPPPSHWLEELKIGVLPTENNGVTYATLPSSVTDTPSVTALSACNSPANAPGKQRKSRLMAIKFAKY